MKRLLVGLVLSTVSATAVVASDLSIELIGDIQAQDVSNNAVVVGGFTYPGEGSRASRWTSGTGTVPYEGALIGSTAFDVTQDGLRATLVEYNRGVHSYVTGPNGTVEITNGDAETRGIGVIHISENGIVVGGFPASGYLFDYDRTLFTWTEESGLVFDDILDGATYVATSSDASVFAGVVGSGGTTFVVKDGSVEYIDDMHAITDLSADGTTAIGRGIDGHGRVWTQEEGTIEIGGFTPTDVSGNGDIVVGTSYSQIRSRSEAAVWDRANGVRFLTDILENRGVDISNIDRFLDIDAISDNGYYYVGSSSEGTFVLSILPICSVSL